MRARVDACVCVCVCVRAVRALARDADGARSVDPSSTRARDEGRRSRARGGDG